MLIDTHSHIQFNAYADDREEVIKRAHEARVFMIAVGTEKSTSADAVAMAEKYPDQIVAAIGLHPTHLFESSHHDPHELAARKSLEDFDAKFYHALAKNLKVCGIGECGLDYYRLPENVDRQTIIKKQQEVFQKHIELADEMKLPLIVHVRDAHDDVYKILKDYIARGCLQRRGVIHCFSGGRREARNYLELGFFIAFGGVTTFKSKRPEHQELLEAAKEVPLDKIVLETDAPYLTPEPFRGKRNESAYVRYVAEKLAELRGISCDKIVGITTKNAVKLFNLKLSRHFHTI